MPRHFSAVLALSALVLASGCSEPPPPLSVNEGMVTVLNQSEKDWKEVLITVNDHFRGFVPALKADGRANAPLTQFTTGHGQRWTTGTPVRTIAVTAKDADGANVTLDWRYDDPKKRR